MIDALIRWLNRLFGTTPPPEPPRKSVPMPQVPGADPGAMNIQYRGQAPRRTTQSRPSMRYTKERLRLPKLNVDRWERATPRQKVLVVLAAISVIAMAVAGAATLTVSKVIPAEVQGLYATDHPAYATRRFELRARKVAFTTSDSIKASNGLPIRSVSQSKDARGTRYQVVYGDEGGDYDLNFVFVDGATPQIIFVNQPRLVWRRVSTSQTLIRQLY